MQNLGGRGRISSHISPYVASARFAAMSMSEMSSEHALAAEQPRVFYLTCNFCNTALVVNIPSDNSYKIVTVRCGLCANLLSVNLELLQGNLPLLNLQDQLPDCESSSKRTKLCQMNPADCLQQQTQLVRSNEKRRVPSAYNRFIKEEIRRLKAKNPSISHKEAFSTAAKNWAHFPEIHFGLSIKGNEQL